MISVKVQTPPFSLTSRYSIIYDQTGVSPGPGTAIEGSLSLPPSMDLTNFNLKIGNPLVVEFLVFRSYECPFVTKHNRRL